MGARTKPAPAQGTAGRHARHHKLRALGAKLILQSAQSSLSCYQKWAQVPPAPRGAHTLTCWWASCSTCCWCRLARKSWCCSCCVCFRASKVVSEPGLTTRCPIRRSMGTVWGTRGEVHGFTAAVETQRGAQLSPCPAQTTLLGR